MIIAITGTPGTGKTEVAKLLSKELNLPLHSVNELADEHRLYSGFDIKRKSKIIDTEKLQRVVNNMEEKDFIIEGHLSHLINPDKVFVLRTHPKELKQRLENKGWDETKVKENLDAEIVGQILVEALDTEAEVFEIDTSGKTSKETVKKIKKILNNPQRHLKNNRIDWLDEEI